MQKAGERFVPWLYNKVEENSIPGVIWVNKSDLLCQIPWQRGSRKSLTRGLTRLLEAWADFCGRSKKADLSTCLKEVNYAVKNTTGWLQTVKVDEIEGYRLLQFDRNVLRDVTEERDTEETQIDEIEVIGSLIDLLNKSSNSSPGTQELCPDETEVIGSLIDQLTASPAEISYDIDICIFYYNKEVMRFRVSNPRGCRIYWPSRGDGLKIDPEEHDRFFGSHLRTQVALPYPVYDTPPLRKLLKSMQRGILLDMSNYDLYATQYGRCSVYCNDTRIETTDAGKLGRYEKTKVFDYRGLFTSHFENHCAKLGGCPSTELFFTFGQKWHHSRPAEENIMSFTVIHSLARSKVKRYHHAKSTPKQNLQLEIAEPTSEDEYVNILLGYDPPYPLS
ncbi:interferon regulatory factor 3-like isoform X2 [Corticium candelabrum]|uniref:interferon regulatory factor 3-like isoform X2 n=1 Tax=Corticium candelabrum TaxID=121492 RepID=UPI002E26AF90|nr:interferon regulatory factor 3-like isoform X2 [Corticium candelabrum]